MNWQWAQTGEIRYLTVPAWTRQGIQVAFSSRESGVSRGLYESLNLAFHVEDDPALVLANRLRFLAALDYPLEDMVSAQQVHGVHAHLVEKKDQGRGTREQESAIAACDALVTRASLGLMAFFADCVPIFFFCPETGTIGLAHAGWKGTVHNIVKEVIKLLQSQGSIAEKCQVAIGPCIGPCCYEVGEDLACLVREKIPFWESILISTEKGDHLHLAEINRQWLLSEGVLAENIAISGECTACHPESFYSYRREGKTGRMSGVIIKSKWEVPSKEPKCL